MWERREIVAAVAIVVALALGAVGVYVGIDAKSSSASDEELTDEVRRELAAAKDEQKKSGEEQSAAAEKAERKGKEAGKQARKAEKRGKSNESSISTLTGQVAKLRKQVKELDTEIQDLQVSQKRIKDDLNQDVAKLQEQLHKKKNK